MLVKRLKEQCLKAATNYRTLLIACSGGVDSMVLVTALHDAVNLLDEKPALKVLHVNFGLRGSESDLDQTFVEEFCRQKGIAVEILKVTSMAEQRRLEGEGIQQWARRLRYDWFTKVAVRERGLVVLAHHEDDVAENVILRLARGTGPGHMAGMRELNEPYWRPFLELSKVQLMEFATRQTIPHRVDSSNAKLDYSRNKIRHKIISELEALYPGASRRMARAAMECADIVEYIRKKELGEIVARGVLEGPALRLLPTGVAIELISGLIKGHLAVNVQLSRTALYGIWDSVSSCVGGEDKEQSWEVCPGVFVTYKYDKVFIKDFRSQPCQTGFRQHIRGITARPQRWQLAPGAQLELLGEKSHSTCFVNTSQSGLTVELVPVSIKQDIYFKKACEKDKSWSLKEIMEKWDSPDGEPGVKSAVVLKIDGQAEGLLIGEKVYRPSCIGIMECVGSTLDLSGIMN
jgi:tRNA(Ile)-lysidine synthetase-like protein